MSRPEVDSSATTTDQQRRELTAEERRKRRELIKAKHGALSSSNVPDHLQQVTTPSMPASPALTLGSPSPGPGKSQTSLSCTHIVLIKSGIASPSAYSQETSAIESVGVSPPHINVSNDSELANQGSSNATVENMEEVSAVDYDMQMHVVEEKPVNEKKETVKEISATAYDEKTMANDKKVLIPTSVMDEQVERPAKKQKVELDMFADVDDDDMFAPIPVDQNSTSITVVGQTTGPSNARTLDEGLLDNWDDPEGYYRVISGEILDGRYHVQQTLGKGVFAKVVGATDITTQRQVAIKIVRNVEMMTKAATKEMEFLQKLTSADPDGKKHVVRLDRSFNHKGHLCMVFEQLSINLRDVLKKFGRDVGIHLKAVRSYAQQIFVGLNLLEKCEIIHLDLKPDNILVDESRSMLKLCDLGSAIDSYDGSKISEELVSRFYRAPEIMLGLHFDFAVDMWSIGCTLYEMYTGKILFAGRDNNQMLRSIMECRGKIPPKMLRRGDFSGDHFVSDGYEFMSRDVDKISGKPTMKLLNFTRPTRDLKSRLLAVAQAASGGAKLSEEELKEVNLFADLLDKCLALVPEKRLKPADALKHPFIYKPGPRFGSGK